MAFLWVQIFSALIADSTHLFGPCRRFGTWTVAKVTENKSQGILEGPICNGSRVVGWHVNESSRRFQRFHADMSGFAFNSTILWDPKRWHRPTLEPIRLFDTVRNNFQVSTFCLSCSCSLSSLWFDTCCYYFTEAEKERERKEKVNFQTFLLQ